MTDIKKDSSLENDSPSLKVDSKHKESLEIVDKSAEKKGPISFLSGALTSFLLGWLCLLLSEKVVVYFSLHPPEYSSAIALSIASGFKTLVIGICFLATFTFGFIGIGLTIVFFKSLFNVNSVKDD